MLQNPSEQQRKIFEEVAHGHGHLVISALAGTGKTTTIVACVAYVPKGRRIGYCAFNKRIEVEITMRIAPFKDRAEAKTSHSMGLRCVSKVWERIPIVPKDQPMLRADDLSMRVCGGMTPDYIVRMVSKLHTKGREMAPHARRWQDLEDIAWQFECVPDNGWADRYSVEWVCQKAVEAMELAATQRPVKTGIDFADMIFLPVRNHWTYPLYDDLFIDEAQDWTLAQLELAMGMIKANGRIILVGDKNQAIYGFRGADSDSMDRLKHELKAKELGLTTTYRCGKAIVAVAQELVPNIVAHESNPDGLVRDIKVDKLTEEVQHGDFVLSRFNAPLSAAAMSLLRVGKRARIAGRDIGQGLQAVVRKLKASTIEDFLVKLNAWEEREVARFAAANREAQVNLARDKAATLVVLSEGLDTVQQLQDRIEGLFTDNGLGAAGVITCSSVHKAKGLEADRVFILRDTLKSNKQEELNIQYVAITRAKKELVWVDGRF